MLVACGGGGSGPVESTSRMQGKFIDSPVSGLSYVAGTESGVTDSSGNFYYPKDGDVQTTFSIGAIQLPQVKAAQIVTPLDMSSTLDMADPIVANVAYLLQALDADGNPVNGITISQSTRLAATKQLDFSVSPEIFQANKDLVDLIKIANGNSNSSTTSDTSMAHLANSLVGMLDSGAIIGPTDCQTDVSNYKNSTPLKTNLWATLSISMKDNWFYDGIYNSGNSNTPGALFSYTPDENSIEVQAAKNTSDWSEVYSLKYDKWFRHSENKYVVMRIAAKPNGAEDTYRPQYSGGSMYLHYADPRGGR